MQQPMQDSPLSGAKGQSEKDGVLVSGSGDRGREPTLPEQIPLDPAIAKAIAVAGHDLYARAPVGEGGGRESSPAPAHSKSEYKRRVAQGDQGVLPPTGVLVDAPSERLAVASQLRAIAEDSKSLNEFARQALDRAAGMLDASGVDVPAEVDRDTDGELLIDWSPAKGRMVTLSLRADGRLSYAITWDGEQTYGTAQMPASGVGGPEARRERLIANVAVGLPGPAHIDHPLRHYDRTCPACNAGVGVSATQIRETAASLRDNSMQLAKYPDMTDEARARELAALYIEEIADLYEVKQRIAASGVLVDAPACEWQEDDPYGCMPGTYASACGRLWGFTEGGPAENNVRYKVLPFIEPADEDSDYYSEEAADIAESKARNAGVKDTLKEQP